MHSYGVLKEICLTQKTGSVGFHSVTICVHGQMILYSKKYRCVSNTNIAGASYIHIIYELKSLSLNHSVSLFEMKFVLYINIIYTTNTQTRPENKMIRSSMV